MADYDGAGLKETLKRRLKGKIPEIWRVQLEVTQDGEAAWELGEEAAEGSLRIRFPKGRFILSGFKDCCGVMVMSDIGLSLPTAASVKHLKVVLDLIARMVNVGAVLYITSDEQEWLYPHLKTFGFIKNDASEFTNPRSGNTLHTWIKKVNQ